MAELLNTDIVLLDRIELNLLACIKEDTPARKLACKILDRIGKKERKDNKPCMDVPITGAQLKKLFPDYLERNSIWCYQGK